MGYPETPHSENGIFIASPDQVHVATMLTEEIIADFIDDRFDWPITSGGEGINGLQRTMTNEGPVIIATKAHIMNDGARLYLTRYLLMLELRAFTIIPELHDLTNPTIPQENEDVTETLFELGFNQASLQDWCDFITFLYEGREFLQTLRSLEQKLGLRLGKVATSGSLELE